MECINCGGDARKPLRREFLRLAQNYLICNLCGKAQRRKPALTPAGRGTKAPEREELRNKIALAVPRYKFKVLVWGPAPGSSNPATQKREQIKAELVKGGHEAYFSEDLGIPDLPANVLEKVQQNEINAVINVAHSPGSSAEFEAFGIQLGTKMLAWFHETTKGGFAEAGSRRLFRTAGGFEETFGDRDLESCVMTLASVDWIEEKKYLQMYVEENLRALRNIAPLGGK